MHKPIIPLTLTYISGLLLGHGFLYFPYTISITVLFLLLTALILIRFDRLTTRRALLFILPGIIGFCAYLFSAAWLPADHYTRHIAVDRSLHEITGTITSPLDRDPDRTAFVMDVHDIDGTRVSGKIRVSVREELLPVGYGDIIRVTGKLFEPRGFNNPGGFDYPAYLARSGIYYAAYAKSAQRIDVLTRGTGIFRKIQDWREQIRQAFLSSTSGPGSAILQAMVLGEEGGLTDEMRDQFMAAGVTHIISISGSHLGMVAVLCFGLIRAMLFLIPERFYHRLTLRTDPKNIAAWLTLPLVIFYTLLAGGQMATVRSLIMISAGLFAILLNRENALMRALALAALFILIAGPQSIFDISFQLSFISVLVIGLVVSLWSELRFTAKTRFQKLRNGALLLIIISLSAGIATGPLVAFYFNQVSFAGVVSNIIVVPFAGMVIVTLGVFSGILSLFFQHLPLSGLVQLTADVFISAVSFFSRLPFAEFHPPAPTLLWLMLYAVFSLSLFMHTRARLFARFKPFVSSSRIAKMPIIGMMLSGTCLMLVLALSFIPEQHTRISFPDVGQGDCALIELPGGKTILIDGGGSRNNRFDIGRRILAPWLWNKGIRRLDLVVLSHPHPDHMNGLIAILKKSKVDEVWESGMDAGLPGHDAFSEVIQDRKIRHRVVSADDAPVMLGKATISVLHPRREFKAHDRRAYAAENSRSLVVQVRSEGRSFLFTGDIGFEAEQDIIRRMPGLKADLIKIPHHGSRFSSSDTFVSQTRPNIAVVNVGRGNWYQHPSGSVVARYETIGALICRTDLDGAVTIAMNKGKFVIQRWNDLILRRIVLSDHATWVEQEQANRSRLWIRASEL
jgi:competence protein ComEC